MRSSDRSARQGGVSTPPLTKVELDDPVSLHLHQDFARIRANQTVREAHDGLRRHPPRGRILYLYVVDDQDRLAGVVPTRRLLLASPEHPVAEIMVRQVGGRVALDQKPALSRPVCWTAQIVPASPLPLELILDVHVGEVEVDRRRLEAVVAQDLLHRRQADPLLQGRRGERVAQARADSRPW